MKSAAFFLRVVGTGLLFFFCLAWFFLLLDLEKELVLSPLFFIYGVFSDFFVSAVQVLA
jgi:hypothetical protein